MAVGAIGSSFLVTQNIIKPLALNSTKLRPDASIFSGCPDLSKKAIDLPAQHFGLLSHSPRRIENCFSGIARIARCSADASDIGRYIVSTCGRLLNIASNSLGRCALLLDCRRDRNTYF